MEEEENLPSKREVTKKMIEIISKLGEEISKEKIQEIHEFISIYNEIDTMQKFENIKSEIIHSIKVNDIEFLKLLISEEVNYEDVATFKINKEKKEASLFNVSNNIDNFTVPRTIKYNNEDYLVTSIFKCDINDALKFDKNSSVSTFYSNAFAYSNVKRIFIPANLRELKKGCFFAMNNLKTFVISPLNGQFIYKDDQYLLGKTDEKSDNFDILLYALRDISEAKIPSNIKIISSYAFCDCLHLKEVIFEENSELEIIEESAFSLSTIDNIFIPPKVTKILKYAFSDCYNLREVKISPDSKLEIIDEYVFEKTMIEEFFIPANVRELKDGCFYHMNDLTKFIVSPLNDKFIYQDDQYLLGKRDDKSDNFDLLLFARRDISIAKIPSNIKIISSYAFNYCKNLREVIFEENSQLEIIGKLAFSESMIEKIFIPSNVLEISDFAFCSCTNLHDVIVEENSKLEIIGDYAFADSIIGSIIIPANVSKISQGFIFFECEKLKIIEISEVTELKFVTYSPFYYSIDAIFMIPHKIID